MRDKLVCALKVETNYGSKFQRAHFTLTAVGFFKQIVRAYLGLMIRDPSVLGFFY